MSFSNQQSQQQGAGQGASSGDGNPPIKSSIDPLIKDLEGGIIVPGASRPVGPLLKASSQPSSQQALPTVSSSASGAGIGAGAASSSGISSSSSSGRGTAGSVAAPLPSAVSSTGSLLPTGTPPTGLASAAARARQPLLNRTPDTAGSTSSGPARRLLNAEAIPPAVRRLSTAGTNNNVAASASSRFKGTPPRSTRYSLPVRTGPTPAPRIAPERSTTLPTLGHTRPLIKQIPNALPPSALKRPTALGTTPVQQPARYAPAHARAPPRYPKSSGPAFHTFERLLPAARVSTPLPRVTSFAIGTALHLPTLIGFLRREHGVKPRLYDECVYVVYVKPLLPGFGRANVRSAPEPRTGSPGGESRRERQMEAREESGYIGSYFAAQKEEEEIDPQGYIEEADSREHEDEAARRRARAQRERDGDEADGAIERNFETETETEAEREKGTGGRSDIETEAEDDSALQRLLIAAPDGLLVDIGEITPDPSKPTTPALEVPPMTDLDESGSATPRMRPTDPFDSPMELDVRTPVAELLGDPILNDGSALLDSPEAPLPLTLPRADSREELGADENGNGGGNGKSKNGSKSGKERRNRKRRGSRKVSMPNLCSHNHDASPNMLTTREISEALQLAELIILPYGVLVMYNFSAIEERQVIEDIVSSGGVRGPLSPEDEETEAFHFCYDPTVPAPRIFNDFFTFRAPNHLLKLSLAHAIAQSTKLSVFEESMQRTLELTSHIPKELANTGELKLKRREALRLTGRLFKLRVDVNLTSNVASVPELFWSHATLKALYDPIRDYLEIDQRVENLNERLAVANDLLEIIHEDIANKAMSNITLIIIILILVACLVACGEISARLILHNRAEVARTSGLWRSASGNTELTRLVKRTATGLVRST
ncbi:unnamed protein product [Tilletia laevis]|uniref:DUF155 domain-containing protein n=1 Tax=Tilletia caries TaxID=13290 RepID=A0ABN7J4S5_9BASI|nr:unnamed protein product [Tilletia caries]CAD6963156.1 unnamed protein product [Tilletia caries]CAD6965233.1 unnamed protein product [Tilletia laevis]CAD7067714.1 unnamed protein product [Tilletia caries]